MAGLHGPRPAGATSVASRSSPRQKTCPVSQSPGGVLRTLGASFDRARGEGRYSRRRGAARGEGGANVHASAGTRGCTERGGGAGPAGGAGVAAARAAPRGAGRGGGGRSGQSAGLLLRGLRRGRLEDDRCRRHLGQRLGRPLQDGGRRRAGGGALGPERDLRRDGRDGDPRQRGPRRRGLPLDRRRGDLGTPGAGGDAPHRARPGRSARSGHRLRRGAGARLGAEPGARRLPLEGRRRELGAGAAPGGPGRRDRPLARPPQPAHPLRGALGGRAHALQPEQRWPGERALQVDRRRRHLGRDHPQPRPAGGDHRQDRRGPVAGAAGARLGAGGGRGRGALPLGRRRGDLAAGLRERRPAAAGLVLHAHLRRPPRPGDGLGPQPPVLEVDRRRQELHRGADAARRQPRSLDRPGEPAAADRGERRRRLRLVQRRRVVVDDLQPADRPVLPRHRRHAVPLPRLRLAAGQQRDHPAEPLDARRDHRGRLVRAGRRRERLYRRAPRQPEYRLRRRDRQRAGGWPALPLRPRDRPGPQHHRLAGAEGDGRGGRVAEAPLPVDLPGRTLAARPERPVRCGRARLPLD